jgi:hypothetical protein
VQPAPAWSLLQVLQRIPDPRGRQGRRHPFAAMLATIVCSMLCGARSYSAIADWIHAQPPEFWYLLGFTRTPAKLGAFRKLLMKLAPQVLEDALRPWVNQLLAEEEPAREASLQPVAMDGKSLCGTLAERFTCCLCSTSGRVLHSPSRKSTAKPTSTRRL